MVATVTNALTSVSLVNDNTGFTVWKRDGTGGTPSAISETDVYLQGTGACSIKVSNQGIVLAYGTGGLNLSATGTHVYIWVNMLAGGLMATRANNGLCVCLSSDATLSSGSNYSFWAVDGSDTYPGGWVRYVIDVSKTRTTGAGTLNLSSVQHIGMYCDTRPNVAKFDNLVIDRIDYTTHGTGLRVYGTSTTDATWADILAADEGTIGNKYGVVTSKEGIIYVRGTIELGDDVGTNAATLTDTDSIVVFESPQYYNGTSVVDAVSTSFQQFKVVGNGTGATSVTFGAKVGSGDTASGRNGVTFVQSSAPVTIDFDDGNANTVLVYGSSFQGISGGLSWGTNTNHESIGNSFSGCTTFDPVGGIVIRDCSFIGVYDDGTADASTRAALLWNSSMDIKNSNFIANSHSSSDVAYGVEHDAIDSVASGTVTTADATGTTLIDSAASFLSTVAVNDYVYNETDSSYGQVSSVDSNTQVTLSALTGGTDNDFDISDAYSISPAVTYDGLTFSSNEKDVYNSTTDALFVSKSNGSNPATNDGIVQFLGAVTVTITVLDVNNSPVQNAQTTVRLSSDNSSILNTDTNASGVASTSYTGATPATVLIKVRKSSPGDTRYQNYSTTGTIGTGGLDVTVVLVEDGVL